MKALLLLVLALTSLACVPSQLATSAISIEENRIIVKLAQIEEDKCPVLEAQTKATVNGVPVDFSERGSGSCRQFENNGRSYLSLAPRGNGPPPKMWGCQCHPAVLALAERTEAAEVTICDGQACTTARWPGATPLPTAELATPVRADAPVVVQFRPALSSEELFRLVSIRRGGGDVFKTQLTWADGSVTVPTHPTNAEGITVTMARFETFKPTKCEGFDFCSPRAFLESAVARFRP